MDNAVVKDRGCASSIQIWFFYPKASKWMRMDSGIFLKYYDEKKNSWPEKFINYIVAKLYFTEPADSAGLNSIL